MGMGLHLYKYMDNWVILEGQRFIYCLYTVTIVVSKRLMSSRTYFNHCSISSHVPCYASALKVDSLCMMPVRGSFNEEELQLFP